MGSKCIAVRLPTVHERRVHGGEVVFERRDTSGRVYRVFAARCYGSWTQWGAPTWVLRDNAAAVEAWRQGRLPVKPTRGDNQ